MTPDWAALLPVLVLTGVGALLPLIGAFRSVRASALATIAVVGVLVAGVLTLATVLTIPGVSAVDAAGEPVGGRLVENGTRWGGDVASGFMPRVAPDAAAPLTSFRLLELTPFVALFDLVFLAVALLVALASPRYLRRRHQGEYYSLILLSTVGMMLVAASRELITLFVALELSSFCTYALAGFHKRKLASAEAAMKYFLVGSISSALAIFGISMVYGLTGSTSFEALASLWGAPVGGASTLADQMFAGRFTLGVFVWGLLLAGFGYKIALVPFHNYAADVYEGAPTTVSAFLAAGSKQMGFAALFKIFLLGLFAVKLNWEVMIGVIAVVTMIVGNVAALSQTNVKRMLAYSSIGQAGYILMALAIGTQDALTGGIFHIITYSFMKAGAFIALAAAATWGVAETLDGWRGMGRKAPYLAFAMTVFLLSFAGIPPLAGFASKFVLFSSAIGAGGWYVWLAVAGIATSAVSLVYYWRVIRVMYMEDAEGRRVSVSSSAAVAVTLALVATILLGVLPGFAIGLSSDAAEGMFRTVLAAASP